MSDAVDVLITGSSNQAVSEVAEPLRQWPSFSVHTKVPFTFGRALSSDDIQPEILVVVLGADWETSLDMIVAEPDTSEIPIVVIAGAADSRLMRKAMQVGARDCLVPPFEGDELLSIMRKIADERAVRPASKAQRVTAFFSAKGGAGATLLATNVAHVLVNVVGQRVSLMDLDVQFGTCALALDLSPKEGVAEVLHDVDRLDTLAVRGYMAKHKSGLEVLAGPVSPFLLPIDSNVAQVGKLLDVASRVYDHIVIDLPRVYDEFTSTIMTKADNIVLVMQQGVSDLHEAKRIVETVRRAIDRGDEKLMVVVNRYQKKAVPSLGDISQALRVERIESIPNDYKQVVASLNAGLPLNDHAPGAPIAKAMIDFSKRLAGVPVIKKSIFGRVVSRAAGVS